MPESCQMVPLANFPPTTLPGAIFDSTEQTGSGGAQSVAHALGRIPTRVIIYLTAGPAAYTQVSIVQGTHTDVNIVVTVTLNWKYRILAW